MKIGRITGNLTATIKDAKLSGETFLLADIVDGKGNLLETSVVVADTCSAGVGDTVLIVFGSAARLPAKIGGLPVDAATVAIVDHVNVQGGGLAGSSANSRPSSSQRRK